MLSISLLTSRWAAEGERGIELLVLEHGIRGKAEEVLRQVTQE